MKDTEAQSFEEATRDAKVGLISDFLSFMGENKKWWLVPFLVVFGVLGVALALMVTGAAPFLYTMF